MNRRSGLLTTATAVVVGAATAAATALGGTDAALSDAEPARASMVAAAEVVLGAEGDALDLDFGALPPGAAATVELTVDYRGTVPAEVELTVAPGAEPACRADGPAFTIAVNGSGPVDYCDLYDGTPLPLGTVAPGESPVATLTVTRATDGAPDASFTAQDVATVRASAGFAAEVTGRLGLGAALAPAGPGTPGPDLPVLPGATPPTGTTTPPPPTTPAAPPAIRAAPAAPRECAEAATTAESLVQATPTADPLTGSDGPDCGPDGTLCPAVPDDRTQRCAPAELSPTPTPTTTGSPTTEPPAVTGTATPDPPDAETEAAG